MDITIRSATESDQAAIGSLIRKAGFNPRNVLWQRFLIAELDGRIAGIHQVRIHEYGTREVASGYVLPEFRHKGVGAAMMNEILVRETGVLYLLCDKKWSKYYKRFGFEEVSRQSLPADLAKDFWAGKFITSMLSVIAFRHINIIPMKREA